MNFYKHSKNRHRKIKEGMTVLVQRELDNRRFPLSTISALWAGVFSGMIDLPYLRKRKRLAGRFRKPVSEEPGAVHAKFLYEGG